MSESPTPPIGTAHGRRYEYLRVGLSAVMFLFMVLSALAMAVILAIAVYTIFESVYTYMKPGVEATAYAGGGEQALPAKTVLLVDIVKSVELMFLAPLAFLLVVAIGMYGEEILTGREVKLAKKQFQTVKSFTAALFISVTTAHVVVTLISGQEKEWQQHIPAVALILILAIYIAILERFAE